MSAFGQEQSSTGWVPGNVSAFSLKGQASGSNRKEVPLEAKPSGIGDGSHSFKRVFIVEGDGRGDLLAVCG